ncbi:MAG: DUF1320 domain-containing protein [Bacillota bacterium]
MYCTYEDLKNRAPEAKIVELVDDEGAGVLTPQGQQRIDQAIAAAVDEINPYCMKRYPVPFNPVPGIIRNAAADIALYNLFTRRGYDEESADKSILERYKNAVRILEGISAGRITLGQPEPPPESGVSFNSGERRFSRKKLEAF